MPAADEAIEILRGVIVAGSRWVLFEHGTVVVLADEPPPADLAAAAIALLRERGPVAAGGPGGDFGVLTLPEDRGWLVTSHAEEIFTFVPLDAEHARLRTDLSVGLLGRSRRQADARQLAVVHVEDLRDGDR